MLTFTSPKKNMLIKFVFGVVVGSLTFGVLAQSATDIQARTGNSAYLQDGRGVIVRNPFGLCWRSGYWTPADSVTGCDGLLAPPVAKIIAPEIPSAAPPAPPPPPPIAVAQEPKSCNFSVTLINDQTFAFNSALLAGPAKRRIDEEVLSKLSACTKIESIVVTGHTDRIGTQQYNQKLSERRAKSVAAYMRIKNQARNIRAIGMGESLPIELCDGRLSRAELIQCLAPNRRVVIDVKGTIDQ